MAQSSIQNSKVSINLTRCLPQEEQTSTDAATSRAVFLDGEAVKELPIPGFIDACDRFSHRLPDVFPEALCISFQGPLDSIRALTYSRWSKPGDSDNVLAFKRWDTCMEELALGWQFY